MNDIFKLLIILNPIFFILIILLIYFVVNKFLKKEIKLKYLELNNLTKKDVIPLKLQSYERMALFLERIRPDFLVRNIQGLSNINDYEFAYIDSIQKEYEHNISQQIYITAELWQTISMAKNANQKLIRDFASKYNDKKIEINILDFKKDLINNSLKPNNPSDLALLALNKEVSLLFN